MGGTSTSGHPRDYEMIWGCTECTSAVCQSLHSRSTLLPIFTVELQYTSIPPISSLCETGAPLSTYLRVATEVKVPCIVGCQYLRASDTDLSTSSACRKDASATGRLQWQDCAPADIRFALVPVLLASAGLLDLVLT